jgi:cytochrome c oxidase cbb3-type subunit 3
MEKSSKISEDALSRPQDDDPIEGLQKRVPNCWLWILSGIIIFSFCYWLRNQWVASNVPAIQTAQIAAVKTDSPEAVMTDEQLWQMSEIPDIVKAGSETFGVLCASCHGVGLEGNTGPNLADRIWLHGSNPTQIANVIREGVPAKGMPAWGPVLGNRRVFEATAFILSHHRQSEIGGAE